MIKQITIHSSNNHFGNFYYRVDVCIGKSIYASIYRSISNSVQDVVSSTLWNSARNSIEYQIIKEVEK